MTDAAIPNNNKEETQEAQEIPRAEKGARENMESEGHSGISRSRSKHTSVEVCLLEGVDGIHHISIVCISCFCFN